MSEIHIGTCFCGAVEIEARGAPFNMGFCHCKSCRAYSGTLFIPYTLWSPEQVTVTKGAEHLGQFNKSGFSNRRHCKHCGGHLLSEHPDFGFTDVLAGVLPTLAFKPQMHVHYANAVLPVQDGLPKMRDLPAEAGGSGEVLPE